MGLLLGRAPLLGEIRLVNMSTSWSGELFQGQSPWFKSQLDSWHAQYFVLLREALFFKFATQSQVFTTFYKKPLENIIGKGKNVVN